MRRYMKKIKLRKKNGEENIIFNNDFNEKQLMQSYLEDGIKYILNELARK